MNDDRRYELISAYLDDELTPAEQTEVEQLLAEDASARQLSQELRALSDTLRALPRHELDGALADQVLRQAERTVLTQRERSDEPTSSSGGGGAGWLSKIPFGRNPRSWGWAAAAIAAAVLLMIFNPEQEPEHVPVARRAPRAPADAEMSAQRESETQEAAPEAMRAAPQADELAEERVAESASELQGGAALRGAAPPAENRMREDRAVEMAPPPAAAMQAPRMMMQRAESAPPPAETAADMAMEAAPAPAAADGQLEEQLAQLSSEGVMVVQIDVTPEAASRAALEEILSNQAIALDQPPAEANAQAAQQASDAAGSSPAQQFGQRAREGVPGQEGAALAQRDKQQETDGAESPLQMVYLEASPEAVEATLADLASRPQDFPAIEVEPAPGVLRQQSLSSYARGQLQLQTENAPSAAPLAMRKFSASRAQKVAPLSAQGARAPRPQAFSAAEPQAMQARAPRAAQSSDAAQQQRRQQALGRAQRVRTPQEIQQTPPAAASGSTLAESAATEKRAPGQAAKSENGKREPQASDASPSEPAATALVPTAAGQMRVLFLLRVQSAAASPAPMPANDSP